MKLRERITRAWAAFRGDNLRAEGYPKTILLGGGLHARVASAEDEHETRDWTDRISHWNGEHSA